MLKKYRFPHLLDDLDDDGMMDDYEDDWSEDDERAANIMAIPFDDIMRIGRALGDGL